MKNTFALILLFIWIAVGCQKEFNPPDGVIPPSGGGDTIDPPGNCNTYFPTTLGTFWHYSNTGGPDNVITVVGPDTLISGNTFHKLNSTQSGTGFIRDNNGDIYQYANLGALGTVMINPLRTNAAIGATWKDSSIVNGIEEIFEYKMLEKNISYQFSNATFSNVIHTQYTVMLNSPPNFNNEVVQITHVWFGKCAGPLQIKTVPVFSGVPSDTLTTTLKSYQVK